LMQTNISLSKSRVRLADSICLSRNSPPQTSQCDEGGGSTRVRIRFPFARYASERGSGGLKRPRLTGFLEAERLALTFRFVKGCTFKKGVSSNISRRTLWSRAQHATLAGNPAITRRTCASAGRSATQAECSLNIQMLPSSGNTKRSTGSIRTAWGAAIGSRREIDRAPQRAEVQLVFFRISNGERRQAVLFPFRQLNREEISGLLFASDRRNSDKGSKASF